MRIHYMNGTRGNLSKEQKAELVLNALVAIRYLKPQMPKSWNFVSHGEMWMPMLSDLASMLSDFVAMLSDLASMLSDFVPMLSDLASMLSDLAPSLSDLP